MGRVSKDGLTGVFKTFCQKFCIKNSGRKREDRILWKRGQGGKSMRACTTKRWGYDVKLSAQSNGESCGGKCLGGCLEWL